jgi:CBS domain-containing protein
MLRAAVWGATKDRSKGTRVAAVLGLALGYGLIAYGGYALLRAGFSFNAIWSIGLGYLILQSARAARAQEAFSERLQGVTVADVMDAEPVTIPADLDAATAYSDFFERYSGWEWFAVVEADGRYVGLAHRVPFGQAAQEAGDLAVRELTTAGSTDAQVPADTSLEALIGSEPLRRHGALVALDREGRLQGVVTLEQVSRALSTHLAPVGR